MYVYRWICQPLAALGFIPVFCFNTDGVSRIVKRVQRAFEQGHSVRPNAELTGRQRYGAWPVRRMIGRLRRAGQVPCRWRSG